MTQDIMEDEDIEEIETVGVKGHPNVPQLNGFPAIPMKFPDDPAFMMSRLPAATKKRVHALKNIQVECEKLEAKFYEEAHALEMKYADLFQPIYDKRKQIVTAEYEPTKDEIKWVEPGEEPTQDEGDEKPEAEKDEDEKMAESILNQLKLDENTTGIPEFWLTAMKNVELISDMIKESDEAVLKHLTDVRVILTGTKSVESAGVDKDMGFILQFHFNPENEYFSNTVLTKTYQMNSVPDAEDPFSFDGPEIYSCKGCEIDWKKGKDVTKKLVKKKQKQKGGSQVRFVTKTVRTDSFFNFFDPPDVDIEEELDDETEELLAADFEIGDFFRQRLIPKAVLFFTGEAIDFDDSDDEEYSDEDEYEDEDEDEDDDKNEDDEEDDDEDEDDE